MPEQAGRSPGTDTVYFGDVRCHSQLTESSPGLEVGQIVG